MNDHSPRIGVAINPVASFGATSAVGPRVVEVLRAEGFEVVQLLASDVEALRTAVDGAIADGLDGLVVVGGDGMVSLAVEAVHGTGLPFGVVPSGTGNDIARGLGIPLDDPEAAIARLVESLRREPRTIDAGRVVHASGTTWFAGVLSAGFDAIVNERANLMRRPKGKSRYTIALFRELLTLRPHRYRLVVDGVEETVDAVLISVANNTSLGGGMLVAPDAVLDDGLLDLFIVAPLSRIRFLRLFPKVFSGTHVGLDVVTLRRVRSVRVETDGVVAYADGERVGSLPVQIDVIPGELRVFQ
ncbi:diacylglycerol kinase family protein [Plantibacter sp. YIM 135347]|uniref:diacylglycerol kinase family protein n=1 Tax=Plantibacter sp. YIM 135347 TaxID=3423919 RepID=UPI003D34F2B1